MSRKVSADVRRKLKEAAKARWARYIEERDAAREQAKARWSRERAKPTAPASKPALAAVVPAAATSAPAVVAALDASAMQRRAGAMIAQRGRAFMASKSRFALESVSDISAVARVRDGANFRVTFELEDGEIISTCDCPFGRVTAAAICKHKIAAALFLRDKYNVKTARPAENDASSKWREQLARMMRPDALPAKNAARDALLFFSFIRRNNQYAVQPGVVLAEAVPPELLQDRTALSDYLLKRQNDTDLLSHTFGLQSHELDSYRFVNASPGHRTLAKQAQQYWHSAYYGYGYNQEQFAWEGLANALVFRGQEQHLIKEPLEVVSDVARIEMEAQRVDEGLRLSFVVVLPDGTIRLNAPGLEIFNQNPLWLRHEQRIFQPGIEFYKFNLLRQQPEVVIPSEALDEFYQRNFAGLAESYRLRGDELIGETLAGVAPQPRVYLTEQSRELRVQLRFAYNGLDCISMKRTPPYSYVRDAERDVVVKVERQAEAESEWWQRLGSDEFGLKSGYLRNNTTPDIFLLRKAVHPYDFLKNKVPKLAEAGVEVFGEADLTLARVNHARPTISFNISSGIDWFDVKAVVHYGELEVSLADIRKALRRREQFIKLADGSIGEIPAEWLEKYKHLFGLSESTEDGLRVARHHVALLDQLLSDNEQVKTDKQFEEARAWLKSFDGIQSQALPAGFQGELRPYQKAGFDWLYFLRESRFGGCLADDMGTGKTIQTLCYLQSLKEADEARNNGKRKKEARAAHLLVVPRSIVTNWEREAQKFTPDLKILNFSNSERAADVREFDGHDVVLTTYGILLREIERLMEYEFDTVILDEAQAIKNPVSESAKAARLLKCRNRLTLTGTPVENNTLELWSQFAFLNPGLLGSADYFREGFAGPIERQGDEQATKTLRRLVFPFILRRTKDQVALDLPPRSEKILWGEMEPEQRRLYTLTRDEYRAKILKLIEDKGVKDARFRILEGLLRLRQICNHPRLVKPDYRGGSAKLETLMETLETLRAEGHKALIFSQFVQMLKLIEPEMKKEKIAYAYLDGSTLNRQARVDAFQTDEDIRVFLISLKAGGVGLNLTAADYVIHVDPWWNPAVEMQATDRAHRIGQDKPVFVYKLMMRDSVEEKILQLQERKRKLVEQLITTEAGFFKSLTAEDIAVLFS